MLIEDGGVGGGDESVVFQLPQDGRIAGIDPILESRHCSDPVGSFQ